MKKKKHINLITIGFLGCGICCLPLLLPIAAGITGVSIFSFSLGSFLCGVSLLLLAIILVGIYRFKQKKSSCDLRDD